MKPNYLGIIEGLDPFLYGSCRKCKYVDLPKFYYVSKQVLNRLKNNFIYKIKIVLEKSHPIRPKYNSSNKIK